MATKKQVDQAEKIYQLLKQDKIFEAEMEILSLKFSLQCDINFEAFGKNIDKIFEKVLKH